MEIVREAERAVDHQVKDAEESDDKNEHLIGLSVALVGAEVAAYAYVRANSTVSGIASYAIPVAIGLALAALMALLDAYVGLWRRGRVVTGPHPAWLALKANDPAWTSTEHMVAVAAAFQEVHAMNTAALGAAAASRRIGLGLLLASTACAAGGALYLLA